MSIVEILSSVNQTSAPDLTIGKNHSGNFVQGQTGASYTSIGTGTELGVVTNAVSRSRAKPNSPLFFDLVAHSGARWAREEFRWDLIEPAPGQWAVCLEPRPQRRDHRRQRRGHRERYPSSFGLAYKQSSDPL